LTNGDKAGKYIANIGITLRDNVRISNDSSERFCRFFWCIAFELYGTVL